ncbi:MAG: TIR domain-containing protein [Pseudonocardiaceae bacterium]
MARVFISYASADRECAGQLHQWLVAEGHEVFLDQDPGTGIAVGEEWDKRLHERLRWADAVVCVVTSAAVASTWCTAEISIALSRGNRLLPVRAEPRVDHPLLRSVQYADLTVDSAAARAALVQALCRVDAVGGHGWPDGKSPFPGLRPLDVDEHRVFFGRRSELEQLAGLVRSPAERAEQAVLLVVGPSGCGKSSLVRAGLLHVMADEPDWWTLAPMLPGADPVAALARELTAAAGQLGLDWTVAQVRHQLDDTGLTGLADELLLAAPGGRRRRLLLVVDQFEELLTQTPPGHRAHFAQLLHPALSGPVQVVATLRPEFFDQLLIDTDLAVLPTHPYALRPLHRETLRAVIEGPAQLAEIEVDEDLVVRLVADTDSGEALPLLAFTLAQLADGVSRGGRLSQRRYDQLGGVQGALTRQADVALAEATAVSGRRREEVIAGLLRLVTVDEQGRPTRWRVSRDELPAPVTREVDVFVARRLVTTDTDNGDVVVGVAHEAFLSAWSPLAQAIEKNASALRARRAVEQAATEWDNDGRQPVRLWERGQLAAAVADTGAHLHSGDLVTDRVDLSPTARTFLRASIRRDRRRRGRAITVLSVLLVLALVAVSIAFVQQRTAKDKRDVALSRQVAGQALQLHARNPALAAQLSLAAYRLAPTAEARSSLLSTVATPYATRLTGHTSSVKGVAVSRDGHTLATGGDDMTVRLWDISDPHHPSPLGVLTGHTNYVPAVVFNPYGYILATGSDDETVRLWDIRDPHHPSLLKTLTGHTGVVSSVAFSADGRTLASGSVDRSVRLWDVHNPYHPSELGTITGHTHDVNSVVFSPDGHTLATGSHDSIARLWDVRDLRRPSTLSVLTGHNGGLSSVVFSPDGRTLATASYDNTARLWDVSELRRPSPLGTLTGHTNTVRSVAFNPDGHILATASQDNTARLWDVSDLHRPSPLGTLTGHINTVYSVIFSPDGNTLATGSYDTTARLWDLLGPILDGHTNAVFSVAFSPDGHTLGTGSYDATARLWDVHDLYRPRPLSVLTGHDTDVYSTVFNPDGRTLATASYDRTARLWDVSNLNRPRALGILTGHTNNVFSVAFSPDGRTLATGSADSTARLWDVHEPRQPHLLGILAGHTGGINSVTFSRDGRTVATASLDSTARLWDVRNLRRPSLLGILSGHTNGLFSVAFSPDGSILATGSTDNTVRIWETDVNSVAARICSITSPKMTKDEWDQYLPDLPYQPPCP